MELNTNTPCIHHHCRLPMIGVMYRNGLFSDKPVNELQPAIFSAILNADHADLGPGNYGKFSHARSIQHAFAAAGLRIESLQSVSNRSSICCDTDVETALHSLCTKILAFTHQYPVYYQHFQTEDQCMNALHGFAEVVRNCDCVFTYCC